MCEIEDGRYRLCECGLAEGRQHLHVKIIDHQRGGPFTNVADTLLYLYREMVQERITDTELVVVGRAIRQLLPLKIAESGEEPKKANEKEIYYIKGQLSKLDQTRLETILKYIFSEAEPDIFKKKNLVPEIIGLMQGASATNFALPGTPASSYLPPPEN